MNILADYQEYSFLPDPAVPDSRSETEMRVSTNNIINRTYEDPIKWYLIVFSPIDRAYEKDPEWFSFKGLSKCRDYFKKPEGVILTREILDCEKVHINAIVATPHPPQQLRKSNIYCNKYYVHVQRLPTLRDRESALAYITKEELNRPFVKYLDYITSS